ncbi:MAG: hypothetical protein HY749_01885 [Gammaproteobacteria bacterium]|nr:hypothetical protein [Gammaproteobacteria bacterium]MBI5617054.1 hypothetical protein [Gammaproteobacteria bacterium]
MSSRQLSTSGSWTFSRNGRAECARFIAERRIDGGSLFTHARPLEEAVETYELFDAQTTGQGVLIPW